MSYNWIDSHEKTDFEGPSGPSGDDDVSLLGGVPVCASHLTNARAERYKR